MLKSRFTRIVLAVLLSVFVLFFLFRLLFAGLRGLLFPVSADLQGKGMEADARRAVRFGGWLCVL